MIGWDYYSDQPLHMRDKKEKIRIRKKYVDDIIISFFTILFFYPIAFLRSFLPFKKNKLVVSKIFGMGIGFDKEADLTPSLIDELDIDSVLIRIRLADVDKITILEEFIKKFKNKNIFLLIIQNRENITDTLLLEKNITLVFSTFSKYTKNFIIGNAVNRIKWGFVLPKEYLVFYKKIQNIRDKNFSDIKLIGPSVIDFEFHVLIRLMFNFFGIRYDGGISSLLYVDRRGAPENKQGIFDLRSKIYFLRSIAELSPLAKNKDIFITETNWPIENTGKYAPTSKSERISEELYAAYMIRYYLLSISTDSIKTIFWHQLVAPGYGLIDNRNAIIKREAFFAYKFMVFFLKNAVFIRLYKEDKKFICEFKKEQKTLIALWCNNESDLFVLKKNQRAFDIIGNQIKYENITINDKVVYIENTY